MLADPYTIIPKMRTAEVEHDATGSSRVLATFEREMLIHFVREAYTTPPLRDEAR